MLPYTVSSYATLKSRRVCLVKVFRGGRNARQLKPVQQALAEFQRKKLIDVEYIDIDTVKMHTSIHRYSRKLNKIAPTFLKRQCFYVSLRTS